MGTYHRNGGAVRGREGEKDDAPHEKQALKWINKMRPSRGGVNKGGAWAVSSRRVAGFVSLPCYLLRRLPSLTRRTTGSARLPCRTARSGAGSGTREAADKTDC